jgi:hypothetical protein
MGQYPSVGGMDKRSRSSYDRPQRKNSRFFPIDGGAVMKHMWAAIFAFFVVGPIVFVWTDRRVPVEQVSNKAINSPRAGQDLIFEATVNRIRLCPTTIEMQIKDSAGILYVLPDIDYVANVGGIGLDQYRRVVSVPSLAYPGPAVLRIGLAWRCNLIQKVWPITDLVPDVPFTISK